VFRSFLAWKTASRPLGRSGSGTQIIADLDSLTETESEHDGQRFVVRSAPPGGNAAPRSVRQSRDRLGFAKSVFQARLAVALSPGAHPQGESSWLAFEGAGAR
jgi:hypothetical protein